MTDRSIDEHYEAARAAGAIGGKLMGAGGGGFFMFYVAAGRPTARHRDHGGARASHRCASASTSDGAIMANFRLLQRKRAPPETSERTSHEPSQSRNRHGGGRRSAGLLRRYGGATTAISMP